MKNFTKKLASAFLIYIIVHCSLFIYNCKADWLQSNGPGGGSVNCLAISGNHIFACNGVRSVFHSSNNGGSWNTANSGLPDDYIFTIAMNGNNLFAGTWGGGVYLTVDYGGNWTPVNNELTSQSVHAFGINGNNVFARTFNGVFLTTNNGGSWASAGLSDQWVTSPAVVGVPKSLLKRIEIFY